jgi:prefoldin subunit 5
MERQDYINQINSLQATIRNLLDMIDTLRQTLDSVSASNRRNEELVKKLTAQIEELQRMVKNLEDRNPRHNKNTFGKKTHKEPAVIAK